MFYLKKAQVSCVYCRVMEYILIQKNDSMNTMLEILGRTFWNSNLEIADQKRKKHSERELDTLTSSGS